MLKKFLRLTISLPLMVVFGIFLITSAYIVCIFFAVLIYILTGFNVEDFKFAIQTPTFLKDDWIKWTKKIYATEN